MVQFHHKQLFGTTPLVRFHSFPHINHTHIIVRSQITVFLSHRWINDFQSGLINSKKNQKNVKFGLQAHINIENKMNGSDRLFGF